MRQFFKVLSRIILILIALVFLFLLIIYLVNKVQENKIRNVVNKGEVVIDSYSRLDNYNPLYKYPPKEKMDIFDRISPTKDIFAEVPFQIVIRNKSAITVHGKLLLSLGCMEQKLDPNKFPDQQPIPTPEEYFGEISPDTTKQKQENYIVKFREYIFLESGEATIIRSTVIIPTYCEVRDIKIEDIEF